MGLWGYYWNQPGVTVFLTSFHQDMIKCLVPHIWKKYTIFIIEIITLLMVNGGIALDVNRWRDNKLEVVETLSSVFRILE